MKPIIDNTKFGSIVIENRTFDHDIMIRMNGEVVKRKKKLSKAIYGTSHILSIDEANEVFEANAKLLIIGSGQYGELKLSDEAKEFFSNNNCNVLLENTSDAIITWNNSDDEKLIGLFHVTC